MIRTHNGIINNPAEAIDESDIGSAEAPITFSNGVIAHADSAVVAGVSRQVTVDAKGHVSAAMPIAEVTLTDAASVAVNVALGSVFRLTATDNRVIAAPTNPTNGQLITIIVVQGSGGTKLVTFATGTGAFRFSTGLPFPTLSITAAKADKFLFQYDATAARWDCLASAIGF